MRKRKAESRVAADQTVWWAHPAIVCVVMVGGLLAGALFVAAAPEFLNLY